MSETVKKTTTRKAKTETASKPGKAPAQPEGQEKQSDGDGAFKRADCGARTSAIGLSVDISTERMPMTGSAPNRS